MSSEIHPGCVTGFKPLAPRVQGLLDPWGRRSFATKSHVLHLMVQHQEVKGVGVGMEVSGPCCEGPLNSGSGGGSEHVATRGGPCHVTSDLSTQRPLVISSYRGVRNRTIINMFYLWDSSGDAGRGGPWQVRQQIYQEL